MFAFTCNSCRSIYRIWLLEPNQKVRNREHQIGLLWEGQILKLQQYKAYSTLLKLAKPFPNIRHHPHLTSDRDPFPGPQADTLYKYLMLSFFNFRHSWFGARSQPAFSQSTLKNLSLPGTIIDQLALQKAHPKEFSNAFTLKQFTLNNLKVWIKVILHEPFGRWYKLSWYTQTQSYFVFGKDQFY